ncbi:MAG: ArsR/SmtB family transcription factor [Promethearchaeota archaeon]
MNSNDNLVDLFKILADNTRIEILVFLNDKEEKNASSIQKSLNKGQSSISQQLKILVNADLIEVRKESRNKFYKIKNPEIYKIIDFSKAFISNRTKEELEQKLQELSSSDIRDTLL